MTESLTKERSQKLQEARDGRNKVWTNNNRKVMFKENDSGLTRPFVFYE